MSDIDRLAASVAAAGIEPKPGMCGVGYGGPCPPDVAGPPTPPKSSPARAQAERALFFAKTAATAKLDGHGESARNHAIVSIALSLAVIAGSVAYRWPLNESSDV